MKYVYMLKCGRNHYKVGIATSVLRRVKELQTSCPQKIEIVSASLMDNAEAVEIAVHDFLISKRLDGGKEWFELTPEEVIEALIMINQNPEVSGLAEAIAARDMIAKRNTDLADINANLRKIIDHIQKQEKQLEKSKEKENELRIANPKNKTLDIEELIVRATKVFIEEGKASTSLLQRRLSIGYARAARVLDIMEDRGMVSHADGAHPRELLKI